MNPAYKIGIAGLGTVGASVVSILQQQSDEIAIKTGRAVEIVSVSARSKDMDRACDLSGIHWCDDLLVDMAEDASLDCIVELIGGSDGIAYDLVKKALSRGVSVVTANKALLAHHGYELAILADKNGAELRYEAAVAGAIPVIKALREGLSANTLETVYGIMNGTCNYILTEMERTGESFDDILSDAQAKGYAEADPSFDVDGDDTGHKLSLLAALSFAMPPNFDHIELRGIRPVTQTDISYAAELGYCIKLLGLAQSGEHGVEQSVEPCLIPKDLPIAAVDGSMNAVYMKTNYADETLMVGRGAGGFETASAVVADIIDLVRGQRLGVFGRPADKLIERKMADMDQRTVPMYLRLVVEDKSGVFAEVAGILAKFDISIKSAFQHSEITKGIVPLVLVLHEVKVKDLKQALEKISKIKAVKEEPFYMRIMD